MGKVGGIQPRETAAAKHKQNYLKGWHSERTFNTRYIKTMCTTLM